MIVVALLRYLLGVVVLLGWAGGCAVHSVLGPPRQAWLRWRVPWGQRTLAALGIRVDIAGLEHMKGPALFIANHQSFLDVILLPAILPRETLFVAKQQLRKVPIWGWAFARTGAVLIDRGNPREAIESIRRGVATMPPGWSLVMFPEGTRSRDGRLKPFKKGFAHVAAATRLPIVPIAIGGVDELRLGLRWLLKPGVVRVGVGRPIDTTPWTPDGIDDNVAMVRQAVEQQLARVRSAPRTEFTTAPVPL